jgi:hypothetical protein
VETLETPVLASPRKETGSKLGCRLANSPIYMKLDNWPATPLLAENHYRVAFALSRHWRSTSFSTDIQA